MKSEVEQAAHTWAYALCECAGEDSDYANRFWNRLNSSKGIYDEFVYYMINRNFACTYKIMDVSIIDIMIWQIDMFKAGLDMGRPERDNPDRLLLTAFATMLDMEENPEIYVAKLKSDTGTDYPGKF